MPSRIASTGISLYSSSFIPQRLLSNFCNNFLNSILSERRSRSRNLLCSTLLSHPIRVNRKFTVRYITRAQDKRERVLQSANSRLNATPFQRICGENGKKREGRATSTRSKPLTCETLSPRDSISFHRVHEFFSSLFVIKVLPFSNDSQS